MSRIITDYYKFEQLPESKSKYRFDCIEGTNTYPSFEALRNKKGELFFYYTPTPERFNADVRRKADMAISKSRNISSVFVPDVKLPFAYGDNRGTTDAILIAFSNENRTMEIFICRGQKFNKRQLYFLFVDGELNAEIEALKAIAQNEK